MLWKALATVLIALVVSLGEVLAKHQKRYWRDIVTLYLFLYLGLNGTFALIAYWLLPAAAQFVLKAEFTPLVQGDSWARVVFAAFGYLAIVRSKAFTVGNTPIGPEALYDAFANYCLRHSNRLILQRENRFLDEMYVKYSFLRQYEIALDDRLHHAQDSDKETIRAQKDVVLSSNCPDHVKCKRLGELLLRIVTEKQELEYALQSVPKSELQN